MPRSNVHTQVFPTVLDKAPASNSSQGEFRLLGVMQIIPALADASFDDISLCHNEPLSISADESQGLKALTTFGSQLRRASASAPLLGPDQLTKISMAPTLCHGYFGNPDGREVANHPDSQISEGCRARV